MQPDTHETTTSKGLFTARARVFSCYSPGLLACANEVALNVAGVGFLPRDHIPVSDRRPTACHGKCKQASQNRTLYLADQNQIKGLTGTTTS